MPLTFSEDKKILIYKLGCNEGFYFFLISNLIMLKRKAKGYPKPFRTLVE